MRYSVIINRDDEGHWLASVPALPGCHTWGKSRKEAIANAQEAILGCIESLQAGGDPIPQETGTVELIQIAVP